MSPSMSGSHCARSGRAVGSGLQIHGPFLDGGIVAQQVLGDLVRGRVRQFGQQRHVARHLDGGQPGQHHSATSASDTTAPGRGATTTRISSSPSSDGTARAAASNTAGCSLMTISSSAAAIFSPRRRMMSFLRETWKKKPSASRRTRSPVLSHSPAKAWRVCSGSRKYPCMTMGVATQSSPISSTPTSWPASSTTRHRAQGRAGSGCPATTPMLPGLSGPP